MITIWSRVWACPNNLESLNKTIFLLSWLWFYVSWNVDLTWGVHFWVFKEVDNGLDMFFYWWDILGLFWYPFSNFVSWTWAKASIGAKLHNIACGWYSWVGHHNFLLEYKGDMLLSRLYWEDSMRETIRSWWLGVVNHLYVLMFAGQ